MQYFFDSARNKKDEEQTNLSTSVVAPAVSYILVATFDIDVEAP